MPVTIDWYDNDHTIISLCYIGDWTLSEAVTNAEQINDFAMQVSGRFDIVADFLQASYTPPIGALWEWKQRAIARHHEFLNWGCTVFITTGRVMQAYIDEGIHSTDAIQQHIRLARSIEEAIRIIQTDRGK